MLACITDSKQSFVALMESIQHPVCRAHTTPQVREAVVTAGPCAGPRQPSTPAASACGKTQVLLLD